MIRLFLASYASRMIYECIREYSLNPVETKVGFIPNAADSYDDPWFMKQDLHTLEQLGFQVKVIDLNKTQDSFLYDQLCKVDMLFVAGGNTFDLLSAAQKSGFLPQAKGLIEDGLLYVGSSAGSVLAAGDLTLIRHIDPIKESVQLDGMKGFGLLDFLPLPHLGNANYGDSFSKLFSNEEVAWQPIIAFTDYQAVIVEDDNFRIIEQKSMPSPANK